MDKKELKKQYKQTLQPMGIYRIKNLTTGKIFIGSGKNLPGKLNSIKFQLKTRSYVNKELQKDYMDSGAENFSFEIIDQLEPREDPAYDYTDDLAVLEQMWLDRLQPYDEKGYNKRPKQK